MIGELKPNLDIYSLQHFDISTLLVESRHLKGNPLGDPYRRFNPVMVPKKPRPLSVPVVYVLAGFSGNGCKYFNYRSFEDNLVEEIDRLATRGLAPKAIYVFVDAITFWGGSQFINSSATGRYEDYIVDELYSAVASEFEEIIDLNRVCVMGGSSGGFGALHLLSKYPYQFGYGIAIAPDSFFEHSLLPDIYKALPVLSRHGGIQGVEKEIKRGNSQRISHFHAVVNAIGMSSCYSADKNGNFKLPVDLETGELQKDLWRRWQRWDPIRFLPKRVNHLQRAKGLYLSVGKSDQYNLQYGARQIHRILKDNRISHDYSEFDGDHFDISQRRPNALRWLVKKWERR